MTSGHWAIRTVIPLLAFSFGSRCPFKISAQFLSQCFLFLPPACTLTENQHLLVVGKFDRAANHIHERCFQPCPWPYFWSFSMTLLIRRVIISVTTGLVLMGKLTSSVHTTARILRERIQRMSRIKSTTSKLTPNSVYPGGFKDTGAGDKHTSDTQHVL